MNREQISIDKTGSLPEGFLATEILDSMRKVSPEQRGQLVQDMAANFSPEQVKSLRQELEELKEKFQQAAAIAREEAGREIGSLKGAVSSGGEIIGVETEGLSETDLCYFQLYKDLRDSQQATLQDWKVFLTALGKYKARIAREHYQERMEQEDAGGKIKQTNLTMDSRREFSAWVYNLALAEYTKTKARIPKNDLAH